MSIPIVILFFVSISTAQKDPVKDFCRRFGHQTTIIDRKLYIDGGLVNWNPISSYPANYSNTWLLYQDLNHDSSDGMPQLYANLSKNSSIPDVNGGYLWGDDVNKVFYLFGGEYFQQPPPSGFLLYAYDVINNFWISMGPPQQASISPVSYGAGTAVSERGEGYYYGGWLSNNSVSGWNGPPMATTGLIKYEMDSNSWTNNTGPDGVRRAEGSMVYIPAGDGGMLVYFGGITDLYQNGTVTGQSLSSIYIYDVVSSKWYLQTADGTIPGDRRRFCAGATWAPDRSSYNIYLYGGASMPPNTSGYDDMYVLSIPAFTWIKLYPTDGNYTGAYPHHSLTCNVVSGAQMLVIGGTFPTLDDCDAPSQWGTHNADLTEAFSSSKALWEFYAPNETNYTVPDAIVSAIGGGPTGGATKTAPANGWNSPDLPVLITRTATVAARTPTRSIPSSDGNGGGGGAHLSTGAIAGIAVGGAVVLIAFIAGCYWCCLRRYRRRRLDGAGRFGRQPYGHRPNAGYHPPFSQRYPDGSPGRQMMMHGYSDVATPGGYNAAGFHAGSPHGWSPQHGSPHSSPGQYYVPGGGAGGYDGRHQPHSPAPIELAASSGSGYMGLTPVDVGTDGGTGTGTGTGTGSGTGSSGAYELLQHSPKSGSDRGGQSRVWTAQVSEVQVPPPRRPRGGRRRGTGSEGGSPLTRPQELSAEQEGRSPEQREGAIQHNTYYHP